MTSRTDSSPAFRNLLLNEPEVRITTHCQTCGAEFKARRFFGGFGAVHCDCCMDESEARSNSERQAASQTSRKAVWESLCPPLFRSLDEGGLTDTRRLMLEQSECARVLRWQYGERGLLLVGETGRCKTRVAWRLLRRLFDEGRSIKALTAVRFDIETQELAGRGYKGWFDGLIKVDVLFLDDIGKGKFTDLVESRFFALLDERAANCKPCIITSNDNGAALAERMSDHRSAPIIRRLREFCEPIVFK